MRCVGLVVLLAACRVTGTFRCATDEQCSGGTCEQGVCAVADPSCASGRRYDPSAGGLGGMCVAALDAGVGIDAGVWPCGAEPPAPATTVTFDQVINLQHVTIALTGTTLNGSSRVVVAPGATLAYATQYSITDCACPSCVDQIEVGLVPGDRAGCIFDAVPDHNACAIPATGMATGSVVAPTAPGAYEFRFRLGQDNTCASHVGWWTATPPDATTTVAVVCVS